MFVSRLSNVTTHLLPGLVLLSCTTLCYLLWYSEKRVVEQDLQASFQLQTQTAIEHIVQHIAQHEQILRAVRAQFTVHNGVTRDDFKNYLDSLTATNLPSGTQSIAFIPLIADNKKDIHIAQMQAQGWPDYQIRPAAQRDWYAPVVYIEPASKPNLQSIGIDQYSEPKWRNILEQARDTNQTMLSEKLPFFGRHPPDSTHILMSLPVYQAGQTIETIAQRRQYLLGWLICTFKINESIASALNNLANQLDIEIYDVQANNHQTLIYDSLQGQAVSTQFIHHQTIAIAGRNWLVKISTRPDESLKTSLPYWILWIGLPLSLALSIVTWLLQRSRRDTLAILNELEVSQARLQATLDNSPFMIWQKDTEGRYVMFNQIFFKAVHKKHAEEILGQDDFSLWPADLANKYRNDDALVMASKQQKMLVEELDLAGKRIAVETFKTPILDNNGEVIGTTGFAQDITARKQAEDALRKSEIRFRQLFNGGNDAILVVECETGRLLAVNDVACSRLGYSREQLLTMSVHSINAPENTVATDDAMQRVRELGHAVFERVHMTRDGRRIPVEISSQLMELDDRNVLLSMVRDITERKQAEIEYRTIIRTTSDGFWLARPQDGKLVDINPAYTEMSGYSREELLSMHIADIEAEQDQESVLKTIEKIIQGESICFESKHYRKDGSVFDVEVSARILEVRGGLIVAFVRDITARKQAERQLRQNEERLALATEAGIIGIWDWDIVTNQLIWDDAMYRLYGIQAQDFAGTYDAWSHTIHPDDQAATEAEIQAALRGEREYSAEFRVIWPNGSTHYLKAASRTQYDEQGQALRMIGTNYDVTEQKLATQAIEKAKVAAESANRAKSEFLANMSHEIRTPMNAIIGLSDLALSSGELTPRMHNYLDKIYRSSQALLSLINDILDYSKVEAGRLDLDNTELHLDTLLENVTDLFSPRADEKGIELVLEVDNNIPAYLIGDPLRLGQVLNNLVGNAVKFTDHGEILIKVEQLEREDDASTLRFSVRDTGIGMNSEQQERLFKAFSQADSSITRRFGGSGLGLIISKKLIEKMGGDIHVTSQPQQGSTFSFTITLAVSKRTESKPIPEQLRGTSVLVVDDQSTSRFALCEMLRAWQCDVSEAENGEQALDLLAKHNFALVLLDWKMPGMDGLEVTQRIRDLTQLTRLPVVIMVTAHNKELLLEQQENPPLDAVLNKPVTASNLLNVISSLYQAPTLDTHKVNQENIDTSSIYGAKILLVEDFETNQLVAKDILERMGLQINICNNGQEALQILSEHNFDAILMDLQMPVMDGFTATTLIRQNPAWQNIPIIAMTAAAMVDDRSACINAGMNDHISKPILPRQLAKILLHWVKPTGLTPPAQTRTQVHTKNHLPEHIPGFAIQEVLRRIDGNSELLLLLLNKFAAQFAHSADQLRTLIQQGDRPACLTLAHTIKGAAANLGAVHLRDAAAELEQTLKDGKPLEPNPALIQVLKRTLQQIEQLNPEPPSPTPATEQDCQNCDWQQANQLLLQLQAMLDDNEYVPLEMLAALRQAVPCGPFAEKISHLEQALDMADYEQAKRVMQEHLACAQGHEFYTPQS